MEPNNNMNGQGGMGNPNPVSTPVNNVPPQQPPMQNAAPTMPTKPSSSAGMWSAVVIIIAVLVLGGFYFWGQRSGTANDAAGIQPAQQDDAASLEADLNATDVDNVDYDLDPENFNAS